MTMRIRVQLLLTVLLALSIPNGAAMSQDAATYPAGVTDVSNTPILANRDFQVAVQTGSSGDAVTVTVCHFTSLHADAPDVCFMNLPADESDGAYRADTAAVKHPAWKDGWVLGYKVTLAAGGAERHAPDRTTASGEADYYRIVVGSQQAAAPQGSAVVEDDSVSQAPQATVAPAADAPHAAPGLGVVTGALALAAVALLLRRR